MTTIEIRLDGAPVAKGRPRFSRATGTAYTPAKTLSHEKSLGWAAQVAMAGRPLLEGPLQLTFFSYVAIPASKSKKWREAALRGEIMPTSRPDLDNFFKCLDSLNKIVCDTIRKSSPPLCTSAILTVRAQKFQFPS